LSEEPTNVKGVELCLFPCCLSVCADVLIACVYKVMDGLDRAGKNLLNCGVRFVTTEDRVFFDDLEDVLDLRFEGLTAKVSIRCRGM